MLESFSHSFEIHFPWVTQHPTIFILMLGLYSMYSALINTDNAIKAQIVNRGAILQNLNRQHDEAFRYGLPMAVFAVTTILAVQINIGFLAWVIAAPLATIATFLTLSSVYKLGDTGQSERIWGLTALIFIFLVVDLYIYGGQKYIVYGSIFIVVCGLVFYFLMPAIRRVQGFIESRYTFFLWVSALYSLFVISTFLYALAAWFWDEIHT